MMTLAEAATLLAPRGARITGAARFTAVGTDSRAIVPEQLFVALRGEHFDGHAFADAALASGAAAAMVDARWAREHPRDENAPFIIVDDTRLALGALAAGWRGRFDIPLIGVTGSNGKTTVKEMCAAILRAWAGDDDEILATQGNFNNDIGLPLTLLGLRAHHKAAVIEMGMNHPGEIAYLAGLTRPTVALVNNAQRAHLAGLGTLAEIAREKGCIHDGLVDGGVAVINVDDAHAGGWLAANAHREVVSFGMTGPATVRGRCTLHGLGGKLELDTPQGRAECELRVPGVHNAHNALAAAAACLAAGAPLAAVAAGLAGYGGAHGRLQRRAGPRGALILDDSYNANPDSVRAAIDVLTLMPGRTFLVLGDMGEVGESSAQAHDEVGGYAKSKGVCELLTLGAMSAVAVRNFGEGGQHFGSAEALTAALAPRLDANATVLVKGSRFMRMERVTDALAALAAAPALEGHG
ncbi:MAG: UDP-N-acetylmuramoyl-tripeptide--D-alanyl-D-alanine ligase [Azoarcus sp.]|jgi:UDP-N-acetylmuramoyl-tripeptide--D-alanyl-D-alanine ligase|nr:UDP-N-acetylmuramoyl-tripeptide--D-alanyl-D-alanine ligase [Azoarcus sp.]